MAPSPIPAVSGSVPTAHLIPPGAKTAGAYYTDPLDRRQFRACDVLLQLGVLGSSATIDAKIQEAGYEEQLHAMLDGAQDTGLVLRNGTNDNTELSVTFTTPAGDGITVTQIKAKFKGVGTLAAAKKITCTLQALGTGEPDDTDLFTPVAGDIAPDELSTTVYETVTFDVPAGIHLLAATEYAVVFEGDFDLSSSNHVLLGIDTVASGGTINIHDTDWGTLVTTQKGLVDVLGHDWVDVAGAAFSQKTQAGGDGSESFLGSVNLMARLEYVRAKLTVGTATSDAGLQLLPKDPIRSGTSGAPEFAV